MSDRISELIEALPDIRSAEEVRRLLDLVRSVYDVDHAVYYALSFGQDDGPNEFGSFTYPESWTNHYIEEDYRALDPVVLGVAQSFTPLDWKRLDWSGRRQREFLHEAINFGIGNNGYAIPVRGPNGQFAFFIVNKFCSDEQWKLLLKECRSDFLVLAHHVHEKVLGLLSIGPADEAKALSPREKDALTLISSGVSRAETAENLKISENTLRVYLDSARHKLGAVNMPHAVALAVKRGVVSI